MVTSLPPLPPGCDTASHFFVNSPIAQFRLSGTGGLLEANPAFVRLLGLADASVRQMFDLQGWVDRAARASIATTLASGEPLTNQACRFILLDGRVVYVRLTLLPVPGGPAPERLFDGWAEDVSAGHRAEEERQRLEELFQHSARLDAVGKLANTVAHDFNNIITAIIGYTEVVDEGLGPDTTVRADLVEVKSAATRAAELAQKLLGYTRRSAVPEVVVNASDVIRQAEMLLKRTVGGGINLALELEPELWLVRVAVGQVEQTLVNMLTNAREAMPKGGIVTLGTANRTITATLANAFPAARKGDFVEITVADSGCGISADNQLKLFQPFFSTKVGAKGVGLGLAGVYGAVKQHSGFVVVHSQEGAGTTFTLYLPRFNG